MSKIKYLVLLFFLFLGSQVSSQTSTYTSGVSAIIDGKSNEGFGFSISLSDDGKKLLVGSPYHNSNIGKAYLYEYLIQTGTWSATAEFYGESHQEYFGFSVKLSGDGNTIAIGAPGTNLTVSGNTIVDVGSTNIYKLSGNSWALSDIIYGAPNKIGTSQTERDISSHYNTSKDYSGYSVSLGYDGNRVVIGEPGFDKVISNGDNQGRVRVFDYDNSSNWDLNKSFETSGLATSQTIQSDLLSNVLMIRAEDTDANTGAKVTISSDNSTISVSSPNATTSFNGGAIDNLYTKQNSNSASHKDGLTSIFKEDISSGNWENKGEFLYTKGQTGIGTDLDQDGSSIVFGIPGHKRSYANNATHSNQIGSGGEQIYSFDISSNQWILEHDIHVEITGSSSGGRNRRGNNVAISNNGSLIVTKLNTKFSIYEKINNVWTENQSIETESNQGNTRHYYPGTQNLDISGDNNTIAYMYNFNANPNNVSNKLYVRKNTALNLNLSSTESDNIIRAGDRINITATFSEDMISAPDISIGSLVTNVAMTATSSTTWTYVWDVPAGSDGTVTATVSGTDIAGNAYAGTDSITFTIDNTAPTVNLTNNDIDNIVKQNENITLTAVFNENMATAPNITIGSLVSNVTMTAVSSTTWTYLWTVPAGNNGTVSATVSGTDIAGNAYSGTDSITFTIDNTAPTVNLINNDIDNIVKQNDNVTITTTFNEDMIGANITIGSLVSNVTMTATSSTTWTYVWDVPAGSDGTVTATVSGTDIAGNAYAGTDSITFTIDNTAPTVNLTNNDIDNIVKQNENITLTAVFNENMATAPNITIGSLVSNVTMTAVSSTTWTYLWTVPAGNNGTVSATVSGTDIAGNAYSGTDSITFTIDNTAPTVNLINNDIDNIVKQNDNVTITTTFNEDMIGANITIGSLVSNVTMTAVSSATWTYLWTVPAGNNGTVSATVSGTDVAGNAYSGTDSITFTIDNTAPTVNLTNNDIDNIVKQNENITLTAVFNENMATAPNITIGSLVSNVTMTAVSSTTWTYLWTVPAGNNGTVSATVSGTDIAGNAYSGTDSITFTIDNTNQVVPNGLELIAYEGFNYANNNFLNGKSEGMGWSSNWIGTYCPNNICSDLKILSPGLTYAGLYNEGGKIAWGTSSNQVAMSERSLSIQKNGVIYLQFISDFKSTSGGGTEYVGLWSSGTLTGGIGGFGAPHEINIWDGGSNYVSSQASIDNLSLVIVQFDYNNNTTKMWVNPILSSFDYKNPGNPDASLSTALEFDNIQVRFRNGSYIDEISVYKMNSAPSNISLTSTSVFENTPLATTIGTLSTTDSDNRDTHTYTLVSGTGDTDNASFSISGANILTNTDLDYETKNSYSIRVRTTDAGGLTYEEAFTITVNDIDEDSDGDGITNNLDNCPSTPNSDQADADGDGIGDVCDNCIAVSNSNQLDTDGDSIGDLCDTDDDNDGIIDTEDAFPLDATESGDADGDGIGDNAETDDDNDGILDALDNCPLTANPDQLDTDGDGLGDVCDFDDDNDGFNDWVEIVCGTDSLD